MEAPKGTTKGPPFQEHHEAWWGESHGVGVLLSSRGRSLVRIRGKLDGMGYRQILQDWMMGMYRTLGGRGGGIVFQHDNDSKHTAAATKQFLADRDVEVLRWPAQSPDFNPIEHLWAELKRRIRARQKFPKNHDQLWEALKEEWLNIPASVCQTLVDSMPKRLEEARRSRGGRTSY